MSGWVGWGGEEGSSPSGREGGSDRAQGIPDDVEPSCTVELGAQRPSSRGHTRTGRLPREPAERGFAR